MALMQYWFSAKQKSMRDALGGVVTLVKTGDQWLEYTQSTSPGVKPTPWNDFQLVAEGDSLECTTVTAATVAATP